jgi:hypothetical protein
MSDVTQGKLTKEQQTLFDKLTKLQKGVALNTINGMKPAAAHKAAKGICKQESNRVFLALQILKNPQVKAFLDSINKPLEEKAISKAIASRQDLLEHLTSIALGKPESFLAGDDGLTSSHVFKSLDKNIAAAKQISEMMGYNRQAEGEDAKLTQEERLLNMIGDDVVQDEPLNE